MIRYLFVFLIVKFFICKLFRFWPELISALHKEGGKEKPRCWKLTAHFCDRTVGRSRLRGWMKSDGSIEGLVRRRCKMYGEYDALTTEAVESTALSLQGVYHVHGGHCLPLGVLSVRDGVTNDVFKENLEDTAGLFIDEARDTFDATTTGETTNCGLCYSLDVITKNLSVTLGTSFAKALASFTTSGHLFVTSCRM